MPFTRFVYVDTAQLEENHEFQLTVVHPSANDVSLGETCYKLQLLEHPLTEVHTLGRVFEALNEETASTLMPDRATSTARRNPWSLTKEAATSSVVHLAEYRQAPQD